MRNYQSVPFDYYDERFIEPGLPYSAQDVAWEIETVHPKMNNYVSLMGGYLLQRIHEGAGYSALGNYIFNVTAPFTTSPEFFEMLGTSVQYLEMVMITDDIPEHQIEGVMQTVAEDVYGIYTTIFTKRNPHLGSHLTSEERMNIPHFARLASDLNADITAFHREMAPPPQQPHRGGMQTRQMGFGSTRRHVEPKPVRSGGALAFGGPRKQATQTQRPTNTTRRFGAGVPLSTTAKPNTHVSNISLREMASNHNALKSQQPIQQKPIVPSNVNIANVLKDAVAITDANARSFTTKHPYAMFFNPLTELSVYIATGDSLVESFITLEKVKNAMQLDYFDHELSPVFTAAVKRDMSELNDKLIIDSTLISAATPLVFEEVVERKEQRKAEKPDENDIGVLTSPVYIAATLGANSLQEALGIAEVKLQQAGFDKDHYVEFSYLDLTSYCVTGAQAVKIEKLADANTPSELVEAFYAIKDEVPSRWWYDFNNNLTNLVMRVFKTTYPLFEINTTSFVDDWNELLEIVKSKFGDDMAAGLADHVMGQIQCYFTNLTCFEGGKEDGEPLVSTMVDPNAIVSLQHCVRYHVARLPIRFHEVGLGLSSKREAVGIVGSKFPSLYKTLKAILGRSNQDTLTNYVIGADGLVLETFDPPLTKDGVLLGKTFK